MSAFSVLGWCDDCGEHTFTLVSTPSSPPPCSSIFPATQAVPEFLLYLNERNPETEAAIAKYTQPPYNVRVIGDASNHGITWPLIWLIGNATYETVLFLEKDFQLVESAECAMQQIDIGVKMLEARHTGFVAVLGSVFPLPLRITRVCLRVCRRAPLT